MQYPKVSCDKCRKLMESDEDDFEPDCVKCKKKYNLVELYQENHLALEIYNMMNHEFSVNTGLENKVLEYYEDYIEDKKFMLIKLMRIFETTKKYSEEPSSDRSSGNQKRLSKEMKKRGLN